jgi:hypothetical protein
MIFSVAHWDTSDDVFCVLVCKGNLLLSIQMASIMYFQFSVQEEDNTEHTNGKCCFVHFSHPANHYVT